MKHTAPNLARHAAPLLPGEVPTLRTLAEDYLQLFDVARWLANSADANEGSIHMADELTRPMGDS